MEDLWPFNEEIVARAIYDSEIPVISAVGHETDFTIADFVADLRAPTPSAAAELAVSNVEELKERLHIYNNRYKTSLRKKVELMKMRFEKCMKSRAFSNPMQNINEQYMLLDKIVKTMENAIKIKVKDSKTKFIKEIAKLDALSPLKTLTRGYSITEFNGKIIKSSKELNSNDEIVLKFIDGENKAKVL